MRPTIITLALTYTIIWLAMAAWFYTASETVMASCLERHSYDTCATQLD